jgi:hypothetical protein
MQLLLQACYNIAMLSDMADAKSKPRLSISFANPSDTARFVNELQRQAEPLDLIQDPQLDLKTVRIYGIDVRIM